MVSVIANGGDAQAGSKIDSEPARANVYQKALRRVIRRDAAAENAAKTRLAQLGFREVLLLRDLEDLTIGEIAQRLGVTREAAKSRLRRARTLVREYLLGTKDSGREST